MPTPVNRESATTPAESAASEPRKTTGGRRSVIAVGPPSRSSSVSIPFPFPLETVEPAATVETVAAGANAVTYWVVRRNFDKRYVDAGSPDAAGVPL
ncbi:hypothetical protein C477_04714 [Haloterrigena salina JCM 13891]|uniref:Uncharacterized protein n=1 Tax=Haloterrigena salina JCM 13891 TaxID=1227488 RepID=M0CHS7_9EURY|nr:hypothetical protein C477_04714 [Haloterrigena salina JCM 13891]